MYDARYEDIVPDIRIVITDTMLMDERRISASLQTVELLPVGSQTRLILTELLDALERELRRSTSPAVG